MKRLRKLGYAAVAGVVIAGPALGTGLAGASPRAAQHKGGIAVALITDFTGPSAFEGVSEDSSTYAAVYEINRDGGILGHKLGVIPVDTRSDPADALPAVQRALATSKNIVAAVGVPTDAAPTVAPFLNSQHLTFMATAGESEFNHTSEKYFWRTFAPDAATGLAETIWAKKEHYTRVATVFGTDPGSQGDLPGVLEGIKDEKLKLVDEINIPLDQPNYQAEAAQLISANPQVIITEEDGPSGATLFGELQQLGGMRPIFGAGTTLETSWIDPLSQALGASTLQKYLTGFESGNTSPSPAQSIWEYDLNHAPNVGNPATQYYFRSHNQGEYDDLIVEALAMTASRSTDPTVYNNWIKAVTEPATAKHPKVVVHSYSQGVKELKKGKHIQYVGLAGPIVFDQWHNAYSGLIPEKVSATGNPIFVGYITAKEIEALR